MFLLTGTSEKSAVHRAGVTSVATLIGAATAAVAAILLFFFSGGIKLINKILIGVWLFSSNALVVVLFLLCSFFSCQLLVRIGSVNLGLKHCDVYLRVDYVGDKGV